MLPDDIKNYRDLGELHLEGVTDPVLMVLKGHLIVEHTLRDMLASAVPEPASLLKARLTFNQLLHVTRAHFPSVDPDSSGIDRVWTAIEALNELRNQMAHRLEPRELTPILRRFLFLVPYEDEPIDDPKMIGFLSQSLGVIVGGLAGHMAFNSRYPASQT